MLFIHCLLLLPLFCVGQVLLNICQFGTHPGNTKAYLVEQWLSGRVLDSILRGCGFCFTGITTLCPGARHINPCLVLDQPRKTRPDKVKNVEVVKNQFKQTKLAIYPGGLELRNYRS